MVVDWTAASCLSETNVCILCLDEVEIVTAGPGVDATKLSRSKMTVTSRRDEVHVIGIFP